MDAARRANRFGWDNGHGPLGDDAVNENCRGCGAFLTRAVCTHCGRAIDHAKDKVTPDQKDDPKRGVEVRKAAV